MSLRADHWSYRSTKSEVKGIAPPVQTQTWSLLITVTPVASLRENAPKHLHPDSLSGVWLRKQSNHGPPIFYPGDGFCPPTTSRDGVEYVYEQYTYNIATNQPRYEGYIHVHNPIFVGGSGNRLRT